MRGRALIIATSHYGDPQLADLPLADLDMEGLREVLVDPKIGDFDVYECLEKPWQEWRVRIDDFFGEANRDDLLLLYIAGHAVKGRDRKLYFAASNTRLGRLFSTGIAATFIQEVLYHSPSRRVVTILDACFSGAFAKGGNIRADSQTVNVAEYFRNDAGRVVITASDTIQYALVDDVVETLAEPTLLCRHIIEGLRTGRADTNGDGQISSEELCGYLRSRLGNHRPHRWAFGVEGDFVIASNPRPVKAEEPAAAQAVKERPEGSQTELQMQTVDRLLRSLEAESVPLAKVAQALERMLVDDGSTDPAESDLEEPPAPEPFRPAAPPPVIVAAAAADEPGKPWVSEPLPSQPVVSERIREAEPSEQRVGEAWPHQARTTDPPAPEPRPGEARPSPQWVSEREHRALEAQADEPRVSARRVSEAEAAEPWAVEHRVSETRSSEPEVSGFPVNGVAPRSGEPWPADPRVMEHRAGEPPPREPEAGQVWPSEHGAEPHFNEPGPGDHRMSEARTSGPRVSDSHLIDRRGSELDPPLRFIEPRFSEPRPADHRLGEGRTGELRGSDPRVSDRRSDEPRIVDPRVTEPMGAEPRGTGPRGGETRAGGQRFSEPRAEGEQSSEFEVIEALARELRTGESRRSEPRVNDPRLKDTLLREPRVTEPRGSERVNDILARDLKATQSRGSDPRLGGHRVKPPETEPLVDGLWMTGAETQELRPGDGRVRPSRANEIWISEPQTGAWSAEVRRRAPTIPMAADAPPPPPRGRPGRGWMALGFVWLVACLAVWLVELSQTPAGLNGVCFASDNLHGWAVGERGTVVKTTDGGQTWETVPTPTQGNLNAVDFAPDAEHGWAVGRGEVVETVDGGETWDSPDVPTRDNLNSIFFEPDGKRGWAVGVDGTVIATSDGGETWEVEGNPVRANLSSVFFSADGVHGWAVGEAGTVIATSDGGQTWEAEASPTRLDLDSVYFTPDGEHGWAVGAARFDFAVVMETSDGGQTWQLQTSPTRSDLNSVYFLPDGEHGWAVGGHGAVIATSDGGEIWDLQGSPVRADLNSVYFAADGLHGWAVGSGGAVIATADGGDTWVDAESAYRRSQALWFGLAMLPAFGLFTLGRRKRRSRIPDVMTGVGPTGTVVQRRL